LSILDNCFLTKPKIGAAIGGATIGATICATIYGCGAMMVFGWGLVAFLVNATQNDQNGRNDSLDRVWGLGFMHLINILIARARQFIPSIPSLGKKCARRSPALPHHTWSQHLSPKKVPQNA